ncbi:hypothetical protein GF386_04800, partial [Candidatus Pacearchaeota archaeon]|nr:hypothetical protein [Candidatus Pacearchaeota archaeon]
MGFFSFFKPRKKNIEKTSINNLDEIINKKKDYTKQQELIRTIKELVSEFREDIKEKLEILEKIDLTQKKADSRTKFIIKENLTNYMTHLQKLINSLEIDASDLTDLIKKINSVFYDFEKKSHPNFQKATFLIGKELGDTKKSIDNFFKNLNKKISENKDFIDSLKIIFLI